jgi:type III secretion regulatory protein HpaA
LSASPQMPFAASVLELSMDLLGAQQRFGKLPSLGLSSLRDRSSSAPSGGVTRLPPPERVQRFNLLFPLLWLHADMPYTAPQRARALDTLGTLRSGTVSRAMAASAQPDDVGGGAGAGSAAMPSPRASASAPNGAGMDAAQATLAPRQAFPRASGRK